MKLSHTTNSGIESAFSKGPGSAFSESPSTGLGPLHKVYPFLKYVSFSVSLQ